MEPKHARKDARPGYRGSGEHEPWPGHRTLLGCHRSACGSVAQDLGRPRNTAVYRPARGLQAAVMSTLLAKHQSLSAQGATGKLIPISQRPAFFANDVSPGPILNVLIALRVPRLATALECHQWTMGRARNWSRILGSVMRLDAPSPVPARWSTH